MRSSLGVSSLGWDTRTEDKKVLETKLGYQEERGRRAALFFLLMGWPWGVRCLNAAFQAIFLNQFGCLAHAGYTKVALCRR